MAAGLADDLAIDAAAGDRQAGAGGAGDERAHVAARGDAGQHGDAGGARRARGRSRRRRDGLQRIRPRPARRAAGHPRRRSRRCCRPRRSRSTGRHVLVTSGPTHEPIDPVRYIANRSSGRQGHAIAAALAALGARVTLVSGPVDVADPPGVTVRRVETAAQMLDACQAALPADVGGLRRRGRGLARGQCRRRQDQEGARRRAAGAGAGAEPRHPRHDRRRRAARRPRW